MPTALIAQLDWSYNYSDSDNVMSLGISELSIDQITIEGFAFPIGGVLGVFYLDDNNEYVCAGSSIWDYQSIVIPI